MNRILIILGCLYFVQIYSQIDTISINKNKYVRINLKSKIENYHISNPNDFYIEVKGNNLFIQALDQYVRESNLFVETSTGTYDFSVVYTSNPTKYVYDIAIKQEEDGNTDIGHTPNNHEIDKRNPINPKRDSFIKSRNVISKNDISFYIKGIYIKNEHLYFLFEIGNRSGIPYGVKSIDFYVVQPKNLKSKSMTEELITPEFIYGDINRLKVLARKSQFVTMVFKKFTLNERNLIVRLTEKKGERNIELPIKNELIIKAKEI